MQSFEIDRSKWIQGAYCDGGGCKCPLGFYYSACGLADALLLNENRAAWPANFQFMQAWEQSVVYRNDTPTTSREGREKAITTVFAKRDIEVTWVGEYR